MRLITLITLLCLTGYSNSCFSCFLRKLERYKPLLENWILKQPSLNKGTCTQPVNCCSDVTSILGTVKQLVEQNTQLMQKFEHMSISVDSLQSKTQAIHQTSIEVKEIMETGNVEIINQISSTCNNKQAVVPRCPRCPIQSPCYPNRRVGVPTCQNSYRPCVSCVGTFSGNRMKTEQP